jgi:hypothetical protein
MKVLEHSQSRLSNLPPSLHDLGRAFPAGVARALLTLILLATAACTHVQLVSNYDEITDQSATELQKKIESFVHKMEATAGTPAGTYSSNAAVYDDFRTDLSSLEIRARAFDLNSGTIKIIESIRTNVDNLENLHKTGGARGLRKEIAEPALSALNIQFTALIKAELAKKRGQ